MFNTGRMWRDRRDPATLEDGKIAKALRNAFIEDYCRAVWIEIPDHMNIPNIEQGGSLSRPHTRLPGTAFRCSAAQKRLTWLTRH